jgi:hypothetical protein
VLQGIYGGLQVAARYVQINAGRLQVCVSEQNLDRRQIGAIRKQVSSEAVPQGILVLLMICIPRKSAIAITRAME